MYLSIDSREFRNMLGAVASCVGGKGLGANSEMVKIEVNDEGNVTLEATDGAISVISRGQGAGLCESGAVLVNHKTFFDMVKLLGNQMVSLSVEKNACRMTCGKVKTDMGAREAGSFPAFPNVAGTALTVADGALVRIIDKTRYAVAASDPRMVLNGLYVKCENGVLTAVALDGFVMAIEKVEVSDGVNFEAILPARLLSELQKLKGDVTLTVAGTQFRVDAGDVTLYSTLIVGKYIEYQRLIPKNVKNRVTVSRAELLGAFERSLVACDKTKSREIKTDGDTVTLDVSDAVNVYTDAIDATVDGEGINSNFAAQYMIDALKAFDSEYVTIEQENSLRGAVITSEGDKGHLALAMPIRG